MTNGVLLAAASEWVDRLAEVGYIPFEPEAANLFFQLASSRHERASLTVTPNNLRPLGRGTWRRRRRRSHDRPAQGQLISDLRHRRPPPPSAAKRAVDGYVEARTRGLQLCPSRAPQGHDREVPPYAGLHGGAPVRRAVGRPCGDGPGDQRDQRRRRRALALLVPLGRQAQDLLPLRGRRHRGDPEGGGRGPAYRPTPSWSCPAQYSERLVGTPM